VNSHLKALTARRTALQAECAAQRDDLHLLYGGIEGRLSRVDRAIESVRRFAPVIAAGSIAVLFVLGPGRAVVLLRRGLSVALYANQALRLLR
jgi:hypothetical protein